MRPAKTVFTIMTLMISKSKRGLPRQLGKVYLCRLVPYLTRLKMSWRFAAVSSSARLTRAL
jgi:hypothetical protein